jgi:hypothetical protein
MQRLQPAGSIELASVKRMNFNHCIHRPGTYINPERIGGIGGLCNPKVRDACDNLVCELSGYVIMLEANLSNDAPGELNEMLGRLTGAAATCGFEAVAVFASGLMESDTVLNRLCVEEFGQLVFNTVAEWHALTTLADWSRAASCL